MVGDRAEQRGGGGGGEGGAAVVMGDGPEESGGTQGLRLAGGQTTTGRACLPLSLPHTPVYSDCEELSSGVSTQLMSVFFLLQSWDENDIILCDGNCHRCHTPCHPHPTATAPPVLRSLLLCPCHPQCLPAV